VSDLAIASYHYNSLMLCVWLGYCILSLHQFDMGGAAATLGAARIIAELEPQGVEVHFIVAACENMIAGK
jgi:leucyl aminopeptidase